MTLPHAALAEAALARLRIFLNPLPYWRLIDLQHDNDGYRHQIGFVETHRAHDRIESGVRGT